MKSIEIRRASALVVAIGLTAAALVYVDARSSVAAQSAALAGRGAPLDRPSRASEVQGQIARTDLVDKMEAALGGAFGGVWYEQSTAQLHVGVTSAASLRDAEAVAAQEALEGSVTATPVRSTWAQLRAAQERWNRRLADLLEREEVATSPAPDRNLLEIALASSVPVSRRAALEREAAASEVTVSVVSTPYPRLGARPQGRCIKHEPGKANCDPTIVSGVRIESEKVNDKITSCTAGPAVIPDEAGTPEERTKTYLLTAGHCIDSAGQTGKKWYAYDKAGSKIELGEAFDFVNDKIDAGLIALKKSVWANDSNVPVVPAIAQWSKSGESGTQTPIGQTDPIVGGKTCVSGLYAGLQCGTILKKGLALGKRENLVEVDTVTTMAGDSGAPWYSIEEVTFGHVEGMHVAEETGTGNPLFQPLSVSLPYFKVIEMLSEVNEERHPQLEAAKYPATVDATASAQKLAVEGGNVECKGSTFHAVLSEASPTLTVSPEYKECSGLGFIGATVDMEGCAYVFHATEKVSVDNYSAYTDVSCPEGNSIKVAAGTCKFEVKPQEERETVDLVDDTGASPKKDITARPTVKGIAYTVTQDGFGCALNGVGAKTGGEYTSSESVTATGQDPNEAAEKIDVEVTDE